MGMRNKMKTGNNVKDGRAWLNFSFRFVSCKNYFEEINRSVVQLHTNTDLCILKWLPFAPWHSLVVEG